MLQQLMQSGGLQQLMGGARMGWAAAAADLTPLATFPSSNSSSRGVRARHSCWLSRTYHSYH